jgi:hypothetical protein
MRISSFLFLGARVKAGLASVGRHGQAWQLASAEMADHIVFDLWFCMSRKLSSLVVIPPGGYQTNMGNRCDIPPQKSTPG